MAARTLIGLAAALLASTPLGATPFATILLPPPAVPGPAVQPNVQVPAGRIALTHVHVIDGTARDGGRCGYG